ncbi:glutamate ABC transporter substrate-binding protein [Tessaracoccus sp. MC1865]|uniref:glutamate ABC transporter substrate-binding protein n=1 Tax=unclassified Tessaracoccus TaxID=2635419 RepID=UPI001602C4EC|nr:MULTISPECIES: glutamate ABC transporter substrate-binding protein [unclassified Tessaracoccus]MBB1484474.1 glutamate ABC transporter substrate-binding protein [Tessaracoccus sp. MC1865]MBB1509344.1 glutamate ABC transporter substrate-binding protein [Tessaracoccus sp. MC1756]QTO38423.1 glutamate ABC transporter substrate-binding protein [Tessaracoccus sp. MC1865]
MRRTTYRIAAIAAAAALALTACGGDGNDTGTDTETGGDGASSGTIKIGTKFDQPGLGLQEGGEMSGFDVDVAKAVAEKLGYSEDQIEWTESPSPQRETMLEAGTVDFIVATYSITDSRKERVQFAGPYLVAGQDLLVKADDDTINGPDDLEGKILCSVSGSTPAERVAEEYPGVQLQEYDTYSSCVDALASGSVDALTTDDSILAGYAAQEQWAGQFRVVGQPFSEELYGIGVAKESELCEQINEALVELFEEGAIDEAIEKNLGPAKYTPNPDTNPAEPGGHCD